MVVLALKFCLKLIDEGLPVSWKVGTTRVMDMLWVIPPA